MSEPTYFVPSPCTGVCTLDPRTDICIGCYRHVDEIKNWRASDDTARLVILDKVAERMEADS